MINFCMKSVHSLLGGGLGNSKDINGILEAPPRHCRNLPSLAGGLSFVNISSDVRRPTNVVESSDVKSSPTTTIVTDATATAVKKDPGGIGFLDEVGGSVDGLMSCTESLGFESSDERRVLDDQNQIDENINNNNNNNDHIHELSSRKSSAVPRSKWKSSEVKKFPPPLSSLNKNGKPIFFLKAVRKDGRLELTEVKIEQLEVLRASRQDGRLILHLIEDVDVAEQADDEEEEEDEENIEEIIKEEEEEEEEEIEETSQEEDIDEKWLFPVRNGGGDGFRRCHGLVNHHHHNNPHAWNQHFVTIR